MIANKSVGWDQIRIQFGNIERGIVELANGAAVDARKESKDLQETILSEKRCENNKKKAKEKARKKAATSKKRKTEGRKMEESSKERRKPETTKEKKNYSYPKHPRCTVTLNITGDDQKFTIFTHAIHNTHSISIIFFWLN